MKKKKERASYIEYITLLSAAVVIEVNGVTVPNEFDAYRVNCNGVIVKAIRRARCIRAIRAL